MTTIGVLNLQGGVEEHLSILNKIKGVKGVKVLYPDDFNSIDGLILPGGESTAITRLFKVNGIDEAILNFASKGKALWGTCAGAILLASKVDCHKVTPLHLMDIEVNRNVYGTQIDSFITKKVIPEVSSTPFELVFIRAPEIASVYGKASVLAKHQDKIIAAIQGNRLATTFHPELTDSTLFHRYFLKLVKESSL